MSYNSRKRQRIVAVILTLAMIFSLFPAGAFAASDTNSIEKTVDGTNVKNGTVSVNMYQQGKDKLSMCNALFAEKADLEAKDGQVTMKMYVAYPVPAFPDQGTDGTLKNVVITYGGNQYTAESDITSKPLKPARDTNPMFGLQAGKEIPMQILTVTLPEEAITENSKILTSAYVNVVMNSDVQFDMELKNIEWQTPEKPEVKPLADGTYKVPFAYKVYNTNTFEIDNEKQPSLMPESLTVTPANVVVADGQMTVKIDAVSAMGESIKRFDYKLKGEEQFKPMTLNDKDGNGETDEVVYTVASKENIVFTEFETTNMGPYDVALVLDVAKAEAAAPEVKPLADGTYKVPFAYKVYNTNTFEIDNEKQPSLMPESLTVTPANVVVADGQMTVKIDAVSAMGESIKRFDYKLKGEEQFKPMTLNDKDGNGETDEVVYTVASKENIVFTEFETTNMGPYDVALVLDVAKAEAVAPTPGPSEKPNLSEYKEIAKVKLDLGNGNTIELPDGSYTNAKSLVKIPNKDENITVADTCSMDFFNHDEFPLLEKNGKYYVEMSFAKGTGTAAEAFLLNFNRVDIDLNNLEAEQKNTPVKWWTTEINGEENFQFLFELGTKETMAERQYFWWLSETPGWDAKSYEVFTMKLLPLYTLQPNTEKMVPDGEYMINFVESREGLTGKADIEKPTFANPDQSVPMSVKDGIATIRFEITRDKEATGAYNPKYKIYGTKYTQNVYSGTEIPVSVDSETAYMYVQTEDLNRVIGIGTGINKFGDCNYVCKLDTKSIKPAEKPLKYYNTLDEGKYTGKIEVTDENGKTDIYDMSSINGNAHKVNISVNYDKATLGDLYRLTYGKYEKVYVSWNKKASFYLFHLDDVATYKTVKDGVEKTFQIKLVKDSVFEKSEPCGLADGNYTVDIETLQEADDSISMSGKFIEKKAVPVHVVDGRMYLTLDIKTSDSETGMTDLIKGIKHEFNGKWYMDEFKATPEDKYHDGVERITTSPMRINNLTSPTKLSIYVTAMQSWPVLRIVPNMETLKTLPTDAEAAAAVDAKIEAIGKVTLESKAAINEARTAFNALNDDQKKLVTKLDVLVAAEKKLDEMERPLEYEPVTMLKESKDQPSMCNIMFDKDMGIRTNTDGTVDLVLKVANPVPNFADQGKDGTVKDVVLTYNNNKYTAESKIGTGATMIAKDSNSDFGFEKGTAYKAQVLTFKNVPKEILNEETVMINAYVAVVMKSDQTFRLQIDKNHKDVPDSGGSGGIVGPGPGINPEGSCFLADGRYYVDIALWHELHDKASMGNAAFENNNKALVTVENGIVTNVEIATNPVVIKPYHSAITTINSKVVDIDILEQGDLKTEPKGNKYQYVKRASFVMPNTSEYQPADANSVTYIPVKFKVPDTPMGAGTLDARLKLTWNNATATTDTSLSQNPKPGRGETSDGELVEDIAHTDKTTGIQLNATTEEVSKDAAFKVATVTNGKKFEAAKKALANVKESWKLYDINVMENGSAVATNGPVTLSVPCKNDKMTVYRINEDGTKVPIQGSVKNGYYVFNTSRLGLFAVIGELGEAKLPIEQQFPDVTGHWAVNDIAFMVEKGLFKGTSTTQFSPNADMTRAMFVSVLARMDGADLSKVGPSNFKDVDPKQWYATSVAWAAENGVVSGTSATTFNPNGVITRQDMASILLRYAEKNKIELKKIKDVTFADENAIDDYAKHSVDVITSAGLLVGMGDNKFVPQATSTRAQVVSMLARFIRNYSL